MNKKPFLSSLVAITFLFSAAIASAAFTAPSAPPPGNNALPPIHAGSEAQSKKGNLVIEGLDDVGAAKSLGLGVLNGNVGLGTLFPSYKLTIREGDAGFATDGKGIRWNGIPGWDWYIQAKDTGNSNVPLHFKSNYSGSGLLSRMTISSNGNVGIGTETPENKLDINTGIGGAAGVRVSAPGMGSVMLASGTLGTGNNYPGYIQWLNGAGTRLSYLGYDSATNMNWTLENGANLQINGGNVEFGGQIKIAGGNPGTGKVLTSDANGLARWETPAAAPTCTAGSSGVETFSTAGTREWEVPVGVTSATIELWGPGGRGATGNSSYVNGGSGPGGGGGGGAGAYGRKMITVSAQQKYTVTVGDSGQATSFTGNGQSLSAGSGRPGSIGSAGVGGVGGAGGVTTGNFDTAITGSAGTNGLGGGYGNAFSTGGDGGPGANHTMGGTGGIGGIDPYRSGLPVGNGTAGGLGAGGGGASGWAISGGLGGPGKVLISYSGSGTCTGGGSVASTPAGTCDATPFRTITQSGSGTAYQNTSGTQLIVVATGGQSQTGGGLFLEGYIGSTATNLSRVALYQFQSTNVASITFLVPPGYYYKVVNDSSNSPTLDAKAWKVCGGSTGGTSTGGSSGGSCAWNSIGTSLTTTQTSYVSNGGTGACRVSTTNSGMYYGYMLRNNNVTSGQVQCYVDGVGLVSGAANMIDVSYYRCGGISGGTTGVSSIVAGTGITVSPTGGTGDVTISAVTSSVPLGTWCGSGYVRTGNAFLASGTFLKKACQTLNPASSCPSGYTQTLYAYTYATASDQVSNAYSSMYTCIKD